MSLEFGIFRGVLRELGFNLGSLGGLKEADVYRIPLEEISLKVGRGSFVVCGAPLKKALLGPWLCSAKWKTI